MSGSFTKDTSYFSYSLRNFDGTQSFGDSSWSYGAAANPGDPVSFGPVTNTYTFNLTYGQPFLVTGTLWAQVTDSEGAVDLMHTARITDIAIPANAAITFLSGAPGSAYGGVSGGVFGQYGGLPGGGGSGPILPSIPEPETYAMLLAGLMLVGAIARRRRLPV
ncbi:MAG: PEP-CTERM sorting domain-containing protein [Burkholderiales bacterium]|nr:PEP-CTERM sorting domain-containing protein [Burkholderiales bacterium]